MMSSRIRSYSPLSARSSPVSPSYATSTTNPSATRPFASELASRFSSSTISNRMTPACQTHLKPASGCFRTASGRLGTVVVVKEFPDRKAALMKRLALIATTAVVLTAGGVATAYAVQSDDKPSTSPTSSPSASSSTGLPTGSLTAAKAVEQALKDVPGG